MSISESRFRQILREEARRALRVDESTMNEGWFDQARNKVGAMFGENNPQTAAERFRKKVPAFMEAYEIYKRLKSEYTGYHRTDRGHSSMDAFGGFNPERVERSVAAMERIANRETDLKRFYQDVNATIGGGKTYVDLESALTNAMKLMATSNPRKAIGEEYFSLSAKHRADMDAHDARRREETAREDELARYQRGQHDRYMAGREAEVSRQADNLRARGEEEEERKRRDAAPRASRPIFGAGGRTERGEGDDSYKSGYGA